MTFAMPSAWGGQRVEGARLRFVAGRCVEAEAESGRGFLQRGARHGRGARMLGEFAFGLNEAIQSTLNTLLDEKIGGTVHTGAGRRVRRDRRNQSNSAGKYWDLVVRSARRRRGLRRREAANTNWNQ